jgi:hypothetical protein
LSLPARPDQKLAAKTSLSRRPRFQSIALDEVLVMWSSQKSWPSSMMLGMRCDVVGGSTGGRWSTIL